jgi:dUTP pyrophosphatase
MIRFFATNEALLPFKKHPGDAGWDLRSTSHTELLPGKTLAIDTGISVVIPSGFVGICKMRSGFGLKGLNVTAGVIDSDYRGIIQVIVQNLSEVPVTIGQYERFAQLIVIPCLLQASYEIGQAPKDTVRSDSGFGSTGTE